MSSKEWPETRTGIIISTRLQRISLKLYYKENVFNCFPGGGILSNNAAENPYWWQANHV